jgi:hypothetical protein
MQSTLLVLAAVLLAIWLLLRRRASGVREEPQQRAERTIEDTAFHAVSINFGKDACAAAKATTGQRFLAKEAPPLPLPDCDAQRCECHYRHHKDRRKGADRRSPFGSGGLSGATGRYDRERREGSDRRKDADSDPF